MTPLVRPALVVIDVQAAFDVWEERGGRRNNPGAAGKIADLLAAFRNSGLIVSETWYEMGHPQA